MSMTSQFKKDRRTGFVINTNAAAEFAEYKKYRDSLKNAAKTKKELNATQTQIANLERELFEMKELVLRLIAEKNK